jgi:hypothetical protein
MICAFCFEKYEEFGPPWLVFAQFVSKSLSKFDALPRSFRGFLIAHLPAMVERGSRDARKSTLDRRGHSQHWQLRQSVSAPWHASDGLQAWLLRRAILPQRPALRFKI